MKIEVTFDAESDKPHVSLAPETQEETEQLRLLIAFERVSFFISLEDEEVPA